MTHKDSQFDFSLQFDIDEFVPLANIDESDDDEDYDEEPGAVGIRNLDAEKLQEIAPVDNRTPSEKTADLIKQMAPQRKVLLGILDFCKEPMPVSDVNARVAQLQEDNYSVFTAANMCGYLRKAGAIELVTAEGKPYEEVEVEPELVVIDGVEYYETREAPVPYWLSTEVGLEALEADKPLDRLGLLLNDNPEYLPIYKEILLLCSAEDGATTASLSAAIDANPIAQKPRRFSSYFTERLEKCDAIEWKKVWRITKVGRAGLQDLAEIEVAVNLELAESAEATE